MSNLEGVGNSSAKGTGAASDASADATASGGNAAKPGLWQRFTGVLVRTEAEFAFFKGLTFVGFLGTLMVGYFQYLSNYQDKVAALAQQDMTAATDAFKEASNALSVAISLQNLLFYDFVNAARPNTGNANAAAAAAAVTSKNAHDIAQPYEDAYTALHKDIGLLAEKMQIYLDWPSDPGHDPAVSVLPTADPLNSSALGTYNFDCDSNMPAFGTDKATGKDLSRAAIKSDDGDTLTVDWNSAKHNVLTIYYCFDINHKRWMVIVRQWASQNPPDQNALANYFDNKTDKQLRTRLDKQTVRLNTFMNVVMNEIERIRVKYRPGGFACHVPIMREAFGKKCAPVRTAD
jgi:hypothetical protein